MYWVGRFLLFEGRSDMAREHNKFKDFVTEYPWIIMLATVIIAAFLILLIVSISARRQRTLISKIKICLVGYEDLFVLDGSKPVLLIPSKDG